MANYIVTIFLIIATATKIIALIQFLMKKNSTKILRFWVPAENLRFLGVFQKKTSKR